MNQPIVDAIAPKIARIIATTPTASPDKPPKRPPINPPATPPTIARPTIASNAIIIPLNSITTTTSHYSPTSN
jgi:hypothetical protein